LMRRFPAALPSPDLILGAGHRTHFSMLAARRARGGRVVVLMKPSLPLSWFDLCLIPEHDDPPARANVLVTKGALNRIRPSTAQDPWRGLFLIGGPSLHFDWNSAELQRQITAILEATPHIQWTLTTSRRTPTDFLQKLAELANSNLTIKPYTETDPIWLPGQLGKAAWVWVTADSVSMIYEALTAGAAVGILNVPKRISSRVSRGLESLIHEGLVMPFEQWQDSRELHAPAQSFNEAARCAQEIQQRWFRKNV
jgi:mitochondrial fission protein ELM1